MTDEEKDRDLGAASVRTLAETNPRDEPFDPRLEDPAPSRDEPADGEPAAPEPQRSKGARREPVGEWPEHRRTAGAPAW